MLEEITVKFQLDTGECSTLKLISKFSCIIGFNSGEGKTEFLDKWRQNVNNGSCIVTVTNNMPIAIMTGDNVDVLVSTSIRSVFIMDEALLANNDFLIKLNMSRHIYIVICRSFPLLGSYPYVGMYTLKRNNNWFTFDNLNTLRLYSINTPVDIIVTEASYGHSENELMQRYFTNILSAGGRDKIDKTIRNLSDKRILVLADLANIGCSCRLLSKRCQQNKTLYFYDYQCFEELLFKSKLVNGSDNDFTELSTESISLEKYYERALEAKTKNTDLEYKHGKPLKYPYLDENNFDALFDTDIGRPLCRLLSEHSFNAYDYLESMLGNKVNYLSSIAINDCKTEEDCKDLINQVQHLL